VKQPPKTLDVFSSMSLHAWRCAADFLFYIETLAKWSCLLLVWRRLYSHFYSQVETLRSQWIALKISRSGCS